MQAVTRCEVELVEGACPAPWHLVRLMQYVKLEIMTVRIATTSARTGPSLAQQLATCTLQMLQGLGTALKSITHITLIVRHDMVRSSRTQDTCTSSKAPKVCPTQFAVITRTVFAKIAPALPLLQQLVVEGCCRDAAFDAFGLSCPLLTRLQVEAITLPIRALQDVHQQFPGLHSFTLTSPAACVASSQLAKYVGSALQALQACTALTRFELAFDHRDWVECKPGRWAEVPQSIREFACNGIVSGLEDAPELLGLLHSLTIGNSHMLELLNIIKSTTTSLQRITIHDTSSPVTLLCYGPGVQQALTQLRKRVLAGLDVDIPLFGLSGCNLQFSLAALPTLPRVRKCLLDFMVLSEPLVMEHMSRVFPHLIELCLEGDLMWAQSTVTGLQFLEPLVGCTALTKLRMHTKLDMSAAGLAGLCARMPGLKVLSCSDGVCVDLQHVQVLLAAQGSILEVKKCVSFSSWGCFQQDQ